MALTDSCIWNWSPTLWDKPPEWEKNSVVLIWPFYSQTLNGPPSISNFCFLQVKGFSVFMMIQGAWNEYLNGHPKLKPNLIQWTLILGKKVELVLNAKREQSFFKLDCSLHKRVLQLFYMTSVDSPVKETNDYVACENLWMIIFWTGEVQWRRDVWDPNFLLLDPFWRPVSRCLGLFCIN